MTLINSFRTGERHIDTMSIFYSETFPYLYCQQVLIQNIVSQLRRSKCGHLS